MVDPAVVRRRLSRLDEIVGRLRALANEGEETLVFATLANDLATFEQFAGAILTLLDDHTA